MREAGGETLTEAGGRELLGKMRQLEIERKQQQQQQQQQQEPKT